MLHLDIFQDCITELQRAQLAYPDMTSAHEGYAILQEEVDELWDEVKKKSHDYQKMEQEALQVMAMAARFINDVCRRSK